jgi:hypothetical protein
VTPSAPVRRRAAFRTTSVTCARSRAKESRGPLEEALSRGAVRRSYGDSSSGPQRSAVRRRSACSHAPDSKGRQPDPTTKPQRNGILQGLGPPSPARAAPWCQGTAAGLREVSREVAVAFGWAETPSVGRPGAGCLYFAPSRELAATRPAYRRIRFGSALSRRGSRGPGVESIGGMAARALERLICDLSETTTRRTVQAWRTSCRSAPSLARPAGAP